MGQIKGDTIGGVTSRAPDIAGRSKKVWRTSPDECVVELIPTLSSFTFSRHELVEGTAELRLDFFEKAAALLEHNGVRIAFRERLSPIHYRAAFCSQPPFEVIVKNAAVGSTTRKYPGLFSEGHRFQTAVVKFDYRIDPEDQPIAEDYLREFGCDVGSLRRLALDTNEILRSWLAPRDLLDFCLIMGLSTSGDWTITSEISPDCMRLRTPDGESLDKDLFRAGGSREQILATWSRLNNALAEIWPA